MNRLEQIYDERDIKVGDLLLTVDHVGCESVERVDCIDNGIIYTIDRTGHACPEELDMLLEYYEAIYRIK